MEEIGQAAGASRRRAGSEDLPAVAAVRGARQGARRAERGRPGRRSERNLGERYHRGTEARRGPDGGAEAGCCEDPVRYEASGPRSPGGVAHHADGAACPPPRVLPRPRRSRRSGRDRVDLGGLRRRSDAGQGPPGARRGPRRLDAARIDAVVELRPRRSPRLARNRLRTVGRGEPPELGAPRSRARRPRGRHPPRGRGPSPRTLRSGRGPAPHRFRLELNRAAPRTQDLRRPGARTAVRRGRCRRGLRARRR